MTFYLALYWKENQWYSASLPCASQFSMNQFKSNFNELLKQVINIRSFTVQA